jgi:hypothetical protein
MISIGQKRVKPLCSRLKPTKAVNHRKPEWTNTGLASTPSASEISTKDPATILMILSKDILTSVKWVKWMTVARIAGGGATPQ